MFGGASAVLPITKIQFWKQITTRTSRLPHLAMLYYQSQRYNFESKSQPRLCCAQENRRCITNHKDTILKANHNRGVTRVANGMAVLPITKIQFWKQITTLRLDIVPARELYYQSQRYNFESKSQLGTRSWILTLGCITNHKDTILKANHNTLTTNQRNEQAVLPITKIQFWKQITTAIVMGCATSRLYYQSQRYNFESKSQPVS